MEAMHAQSRFVPMPVSRPPGEAIPTAAPDPRPPYRHEPVLLAEVVAHAPPQARLIVDGTLGGGGHAAALLQHLPQAELFGCDRDPEAVAAARTLLAPYAARILLKHLPFSALPHHLLADSVDYLLLDLGLSSHQVDTAARGFSFTHDGPLDMRMDPAREGPTAATLVNDAPPEALRDLLQRFGEERFASRIVAAICAARAEEPLTTTGALARVVAQAVPGKHHRRGFHPATRVFQALRIAVNDELRELERLLAVVPHLLAPGGRVAVISFHSLEDRMVKEAFRAWEQPCTCPPSMPACVCGKVPLGRRVTRKPLTAGSTEAAANPRSRSAKLRVFERAAGGEATTDPAPARHR